MRADRRTVPAPSGISPLPRFTGSRAGRLTMVYAGEARNAGPTPMKKLPSLACLIGSLLLAGCNPPEITSPASATAEHDRDFRYEIKLASGNATFSARLPDDLGLTFDAATGVVSGKPIRWGKFNLLLGATNDSGTSNRTVALEVRPQSHPVDQARELLIVDHRVVQRPELAGPGAPWSFRSVMQRLSGGKTGANLDAFAQGWFDEWTRVTQVNGDTVGPRRNTTAVLSQAWRTDAFRLIAIVNRLDLTRRQGNAPDGPVEKMGEGRFVFEVLSAPGGSPVEFTIIFEFGLPQLAGSADAATTEWARRWHALGRETLGQPTQAGWPSEGYLRDLAGIAADFSATGAHLNQIRTNEFISGDWELREFKLERDALKQTTVAATPRDSLRGAAFDRLVTDHAAAIVAGTHQIEPSLLGGTSNAQAQPWSTLGTRAAFVVSFNTCSGCHALDLPNTRFQHLQDAAPGRSAKLSPFMSGPVTLAHPLPGFESRQHDEMGQRAVLLARDADDLPMQIKLFSTKSPADEVRAIFQARAGRKH